MLLRREYHEGVAEARRKLGGSGDVNLYRQQMVASIAPLQLVFRRGEVMCSRDTPTRNGPAWQEMQALFMAQTEQSHIESNSGTLWPHLMIRGVTCG